MWPYVRQYYAMLYFSCLLQDLHNILEFNMGYSSGLFFTTDSLIQADGVVDLKSGLWTDDVSSSSIIVHVNVPYIVLREI
jgi:hypothetical protein